MPADLQTRLLRVLCDGQFYRIGGHQPVKVNVRIIAATHQDLEERVKQGLFREDLFHRLNVIRLRLPALRERPEDIPLLVKHFLQQSARELAVETKQPTAAALRYLSTLSWSGNVRQLENVCHWLTVMAPGQNIDVNDLPPELKEDSHKQSGLSHGVSWQNALGNEVANALNRGEQNILDKLSAEFEKILIQEALKHTGGKRIEAAVQLGMGRNTLTRKIQELDMDEA
jgi:two-component system nitrogen regulation response regulator GlnG